MSLEFDVTKVQEDITITVDTLLNATTDEISKAFFDKVSTIDKSIKYPENEETNKKENSTTIRLLKNIITEESSDNLYINFSNIFSEETKGFIMKFLSKGAQGELKIIVDDTLRNGPNSSKDLDILIQGHDEKNHEFHYSDEINSINSIEKICNELFDCHYLGLGLKGGLLKSIVFDRPKRKKTKKVKKIDDEEITIDTLIKERFVKKYTL